MKILVNTISTKKHSGGAFQISQNFMLKCLDTNDVDWYYITSQDIDDVIGEKFKLIKDKKYFVFPTQPDFGKTYISVKKKVQSLEEKISPDVVYTITAPSYFTFKAKEVMRFTNPWVAHPNRYAWSVLSFWGVLKTKVYCWNQRRLMKAAHYFITQAEATKNGIISITGVPEKNVRVVSNVLPAAFAHMDNKPMVEDNWINIAAVGAPVPHKNFEIIPNVLLELQKLGVENVRFHTTIPNDHPLIITFTNRLSDLGLVDHWVNHGRLDQKQLGEMYQRCQFCFLPTLLEVFSASTVEAMFFSLPTVATDFPFNKEVMSDSCLYYHPKDAMDAAKQFANLISDNSLQMYLKEKMKSRLGLYGNYDDHFNAIKAFLIEVALDQSNNYE